MWFEIYLKCVHFVSSDLNLEIPKLKLNQYTKETKFVSLQ
ncbi:hypothetical protein IWX84_000639 [Flavobacterium sp. CG_9.10]|nr:hypothetical protein [Flavobacterium sp. CG_9.10]